MSQHPIRSLTVPVDFICALQAGLKWEADASQPGFLESRASKDPDTLLVVVTVDPWALREEFLNVPRNTEALVEFLNRRHGMDWSDATGLNVRKFHGEGGASLWTDVDFFYNWQARIRRAVLAGPKRWFSRQGRRPQDWTEEGEETEFDAMSLAAGMQFTYDLTQRPPVLKFVPRSPLNAILGTVVADKIVGNRFRQCARADCGKIFQVKRRPERKFCSPRCAHTQNMRDIRKSKRRNKR